MIIDVLRGQFPPKLDAHHLVPGRCAAPYRGGLPRAPGDLARLSVGDLAKTFRELQDDVAPGVGGWRNEFLSCLVPAEGQWSSPVMGSFRRRPSNSQEQETHKHSLDDIN